MDYSEYGGAPLLGVKGVNIICHGRSNANAIKNAIRVAAEFAEGGINEKIEAELDRAASLSVMRVARISALVVVTGLVCFGAINPVQWTLSSDVLKAAPGSTIPLRLTAKIDDGWHIYSVTTPPPTIPVQIKFGDDAAHVFQPVPKRSTTKRWRRTPSFTKKKLRLSFLI